MRNSIVLKYTGFLVFGYLLLLSLSYSHRDSAYQPIITLLIGIFIWFGKDIIIVLYHKYGATRTFLGILLIGCMIRYLWAIFVPTLPFSDFKVFFHESALELSQGSPVLSKNMGYSLILSLGYRLYPSIITGKLINATASSLSILFLYLVASKYIDQKTGLIATFLFGLLPSEILMVSVLGTEVVVTMLGIITAYFICNGKSHKKQSSTRTLFFAGLFYGLGLTVRSSFIFYLPTIIFLIILIPSLDLIKLGKVITSFSVGIIIGLGIILTSYSLSTKQFSFEPLITQDSFPLLSGTNAATSGTWSQDDWNLYLSWPEDKRDEIARQEAIKRVISNPIQYIKLIPRKFAILIGPNDYANYWSLRGIDWGMGTIAIGLFSQSMYVIILLFAFLSYKNIRNYRVSLIFLLLVFSTLIPHIFFEVQGRYHHYVMPFIILLASDGLIENINMS